MKVRERKRKRTWGRKKVGEKERRSMLRLGETPRRGGRRPSQSKKKVVVSAQPCYQTHAFLRVSPLPLASLFFFLSLPLRMCQCFTPLRCCKRRKPRETSCRSDTKPRNSRKTLCSSVPYFFSLSLCSAAIHHRGSVFPLWRSFAGYLAVCQVGAQ